MDITRGVGTDYLDVLSRWSQLIESVIEVRSNVSQLLRKAFFSSLQLLFEGFDLWIRRRKECG